MVPAILQVNTYTPSQVGHSATKARVHELGLQGALFMRAKRIAKLSVQARVLDSNEPNL